MYRPNTTCKYYTLSGRDVRSKPTYSAASVVPCSVVSFDLASKRTSVRTDTSGTRGRTDELSGVARFLFPKTFQPVKGDVVEKQGLWLEVIEIHPRFDVMGSLDHIEVDFRRSVEIDAS